MSVEINRKWYNCPPAMLAYSVIVMWANSVLHQYADLTQHFPKEMLHSAVCDFCRLYWIFKGLQEQSFLAFHSISLCSNKGISQDQVKLFIFLNFPSPSVPNDPYSFQDIPSLNRTCKDQNFLSFLFVTEINSLRDWKPWKKEVNAKLLAHHLPC